MHSPSTWPKLRFKSNAFFDGYPIYLFLLLFNSWTPHGEGKAIFLLLCCWWKHGFICCYLKRQHQVYLLCRPNQGHFCSKRTLQHHQRGHSAYKFEHFDPVVLRAKWQHAHQSYYSSFWREHGCLYQIPWKSIQYLLRHFTQNQKRPPHGGTRGKRRIHPVQGGPLDQSDQTIAIYRAMLLTWL